MNYADKILKDNINNILKNGFSDEDYTVRPKWEDGTPAHTKYVGSVMNRYDLSKGQFPLTTLRPVAWKTALRELLWIYQEKSNDVGILRDKFKVYYWDSWANPEGNLGTAYGYQIAKEIEFPEGRFNQMERVIYLLMHDPMNRRIMTSMIDMEEMKDMTLVPCAFMTLWTVRGNFLDMTLIQRSNDLIAAQSINATQYSMLLMMVAQATGFKPGVFTHFIQNMHIYDRHIPIAEKMLAREPREQARIILNSDIGRFENFRDVDFSVENYNPHPQIKPIEIAI